MIDDRRVIDELLPESVCDGNEVSEFQSRLKHNILRMPREIDEASGIVINGRRIKSLLFSTDVALVHNCDADAIFAVYPFTAHRAISSAIIGMAARPVFCGVGGGTTQGRRAYYLANDAESQGAVGVVVNVPFPNSDLRHMAELVDVPVVATVIDSDTDHIAARIGNGAAILNVAGGHDTARLVSEVRANFPKVPIMASGGPNGQTILDTIKAGANAIIYSPPSSSALLQLLMADYRDVGLK